MIKRIVVAGGRDFDDYPKLEASLDKVLKPLLQAGYEIEIVSGCARGADKMGEAYSRLKFGRKAKLFPAKWRVEGRIDYGAGLKRNTQMADYADAAVAFWNGKSSGTRDMIEKMKKRKKPVSIITY